MYNDFIYTKYEIIQLNYDIMNLWYHNYDIIYLKIW
jgi:hypothetical protein